MNRVVSRRKARKVDGFVCGSMWGLTKPGRTVPTGSKMKLVTNKTRRYAGVPLVSKRQAA